MKKLFYLIILPFCIFIGECIGTEHNRNQHYSQAGKIGEDNRKLYHFQGHYHYG